MSDLQVSITYGATLNTTTKAADFDTAPSEFKRFQDLAAKLVKVPKSELDEKRKESASSS